MRVLHVVKTADGGGWAADEAAELVRLGVEVHVVLPTTSGTNIFKWERAGAVLHVAPTDINVKAPWTLLRATRRLRDLISTVRPDIIHSHFFSSTILLRLALGSASKIPRLFQVPGPLHLEHSLWRTAEISLSTAADHWIPSSRCILNHYLRAGIPRDRLHLSYYGGTIHRCPTERTGLLRARYNIPSDVKIVGNANFIYPPKWYLGQRIGLKAHEDVIDALGLVLRERPRVVGMLIGGTFAGSKDYERRLQDRAAAVGQDRIILTGYMPMEEIRQLWPDFDVAVHVPTSENCGGVGEPLLATVPVIAGLVGGLPEVIIDGVTGTLVSIRAPRMLANAITAVLDNEDHYRNLARTGRKLMLTMFDVRRTAREVLTIYAHVLDNGAPALAEFDSIGFLNHLADKDKAVAG